MQRLAVGKASPEVASDDDSPKTFAPSSASAKIPKQQDNGSTQTQSWMPFLICCLGCSLAAGVVPGQTLFVEFFADAGAFAYMCEESRLGCDLQYLQMTSVLGIISICVQFGNILIGGMFDRYGGQICGTVGSMIVAFAFVCIAFVVAVLKDVSPAYNWILSYLLMCLIVVADLGSYLNSTAMLGILWHYPSHQGLILSSQTATYQSGAVFALIVEWVMSTAGVHLVVPLLSWATAQAVVTILLWKTVPTQAEYFARAKEVLGIPLPASSEELMLWKQIVGACRVMRIDVWIHSMMGITFVFGQTYTYFYQTIAVPYGKVLFLETSAGSKMGDLCTSINGLQGVTLGPFLGALVDKFGFGIVVHGQFIFMLIFSSTFWQASWMAVTIAASSSFAYSSLSYLLVSRWFLYFAPPNRIGMVCGVFWWFTSIPGGILNVAMTSWSKSLPGGLTRFVTPLSVSGIISMVTLLVFCLCYTVQSPFPDAPRLLEEDESAISVSWGCSSLEEVGARIGITDRAELIRKLSSQDPSEIRALSMLMTRVNCREEQPRSPSQRSEGA